MRLMRPEVASRQYPYSCCSSRRCHMHFHSIGLRRQVMQTENCTTIFNQSIYSAFTIHVCLSFVPTFPFFFFCDSLINLLAINDCSGGSEEIRLHKTHASKRIALYVELPNCRCLTFCRCLTCMRSPHIRRCRPSIHTIRIQKRENTNV